MLNVRCVHLVFVIIGIIITAVSCQELPIIKLSGQSWSVGTFYANDSLWDGQGCGPASTCCTFNNPPWFCKQLPQSTNADLEVGLCSYSAASAENTPIELIEIYTK